MLAADIISFAILLLMALALCTIVIAIEELIWYYKNKSRNTALKDEKSNKRKKRSITKKTEEESYNILKFLHIQRLSVPCFAILSFSLFHWLIAIIVWMVASLISFFVAKKVLKITKKAIKEHKIIVSFLEICFWSFSSFVLQLLSSASFIECNIKPDTFLMYYFYTALAWSSMSIIIFACYYFLTPISKRGSEKFHRYFSWITYSILYLGLQVLWAIAYFNGDISVG